MALLRPVEVAITSGKTIPQASRELEIAEQTPNSNGLYCLCTIIELGSFSEDSNA